MALCYDNGRRCWSESGRLPLVHRADALEAAEQLARDVASLHVPPPSIAALVS